MMCVFLAMLSLTSAQTPSSATPNVFYFRNHNMDSTTKLGVSDDATSVVLQKWNTTINLFDSSQDVTVQRIDVTGKAGATVSLYHTQTPLHLSSGPLYFFHNSSKLNINTPSSSYAMAKTDAVVWLSQGSCITLNITLSDQGEASIVAVTSGAVNWSGGKHDDGCEKSVVLVGGGVSTGGGGGSGGKGWIYNEVNYTLENSDTCTNPLQHGVNGYSQTDEPIGPLDAHFHTRGALYYNQYGTSKYNDEAAPNDTLYKGELRFVNTGVHYGPEEMDTSTCFVASVHEADPMAVSSTTHDNLSTECPFACMNELPEGKSFARCAIAINEEA